MNDQLDRLLDAAEAQARIVLITLQMPLMPGWVIVKPDGTTEVRHTPFKNDAEKLMAEFWIKTEMAELEAIAYSFVGEAWMASVAQDQVTADERLESDWLKPSNRPDRIEIVSAIAVNRESVKSRTWEIKRATTGRVLSLDRRQTLEPEVFGGWITRLLPSTHG